MDQWAYERGVELHFIEPLNPNQKTFIESFNSRFRDECLNEHWFTGLTDAEEKIEAWRIDYNNYRKRKVVRHYQSRWSQPAVGAP